MSGLIWKHERLSNCLSWQIKGNGNEIRGNDRDGMRKEQTQKSADARDGALCPGWQQKDLTTGKEPTKRPRRTHTQKKPEGGSGRNHKYGLELIRLALARHCFCHWKSRKKKDPAILLIDFLFFHQGQKWRVLIWRPEVHKLDKSGRNAWPSTQQAQSQRYQHVLVLLLLYTMAIPKVLFLDI